MHHLCSYVRTNIIASLLMSFADRIHGIIPIAQEIGHCNTRGNVACDVHTSGMLSCADATQQLQTHQIGPSFPR